MGYGNWNINGMVPRYIDGDQGVDYTQFPKISLHCVAFADDVNDAREEIKQFEEISCTSITNKPVLPGGTDVQTTTDGQIVTISDGVNSWQGALYRPQFTEKKYAHKAIEYDLIIEVKVPTRNGSVIYVPPYWGYSNMTYSNGTDGSNPSNTSEWAGNELGLITITELDLVKSVTVYGSACTLPAWIQINGERQEWAYCHDVGEDPSNLAGKSGVQQLTFNKFDPAKVISISTSSHVAPWYPTAQVPGTAMDRGCWLHWIKVDFV